MSWVDKYLVGKGPRVQWKDRARWWLEDRLYEAFDRFYQGSNEEIEALWNGEIPLKHLSDRQRKQLWKPAGMYGVHCVKWQCWQGTFDHALHGECPVCGDNVYMDPYYEAPLALEEGK